jgi:hypothetical protein
MLKKRNKIKELNQSVEILFKLFETISSEDKVLRDKTGFSDSSLKKLINIAKLNQSICIIVKKAQEAAIYSLTLETTPDFKAKTLNEIKKVANTVNLLSSIITIEAELQAKMNENICEYSSTISNEIKISSQNVEKTTLLVLISIEKLAVKYI